MGSCVECRHVFLIGAKHDNTRYCSKDCAEIARLNKLADAMSAEQLEGKIAKLHAGPCPRCKKARRVDYYPAYWIWSIGIFCFWSCSKMACCRSCALRRQIMHALRAGPGLFGW